MKKFDLNLAMQGHPVCTRDGRKARIVCTDRKDVTFPIVFLVEEEGEEIVQTATKDGKFDSGRTIHKNDLFMAPIKHEGWVNVYKACERPYIGLNIYPSKERAEEQKTETCIDTIKIEWEE